MAVTIDRARVIVAFGVDFEAEQDAHWLSPEIPDYRDYHEREYGGRRGIWRVIETFEKHQIHATFFICAALLKTYSAASREIARQGYEIAAHGIFHEHLEQLTAEEEEETFRKMQILFGEFYGQAPVGFRTCFPSDRTLDLVADYGFYYDTTTRDDDRPYLMERPGRGSYIEIPRGFNGDAPWMGTPSASSGQFTGKYNAPSETAEAWKWEFDWLYREGVNEPKIQSICIHPYNSGHPSRIVALDRYLEHTKQFSEVYYATSLEIAQLFDAQRQAAAAPLAARVAG